MNKNDVHQSIKSIKVGKIIDLTNSDIIINSSKTKIYKSSKFNSFSIDKKKANIFSSYNEEVKMERLSKRKITDFINTKKDNFNNNINKTSNNFLFLKRKNYYSKTDKHIKTVKKIILEENERKKYSVFEPNKIKNLKIYSSSKSINPKEILNKNCNNSILKLDNNNNNIFKNLYYIKTANTLGNENNQYSINTISLKPQLTTESTNSTYYPNKENKYLRDNKFLKIKLKKDINDINKTNLTSTNNQESIINSKIKNKKSFDELIKIRKKYPFILNPKPLLPKKFFGLSKNIKKFNEKYCIIAKNENKKMFAQYFSIIEKENFSKKFQNIGNLFDFDKEDKYDYKQNRRIKKNSLIYNITETNEKKDNDDSLVNEKIVSGYELVKEMNDKEKSLIKYKPKLSKGNILIKFKKFFLLLCSKLENMTVYIDEIIERYRKPKHSYFFPNSHDLFFAIKSLNIKLAEDILNNNKNLVLDFDYFRMTALHWAAKYNFYQIIPKLFEFGTHMNDINYIGDTPLLISIKHNYMTSSIFLLLYLASPFIKDKDGFPPIYYAKNDFKLNNILQKIIWIHYLSCLKKTRNKIQFIQKEFSEYIIDEYQNDLEPDAYNIINEKLEYFKRSKKNI